MNITIGDGNEAGGSRFGNFPVLFSVLQSTNWWVDTGANIHVCSDMSLFTSYHEPHSFLALVKGSASFVLGVGTVEPKLSSGKMRNRSAAFVLEERSACSVNKQEPYLRVLVMSIWF